MSKIQHQMQQPRKMLDKSKILVRIAEQLQVLGYGKVEDYSHDYQKLNDIVINLKDFPWNIVAVDLEMDRWRLYHWYFETFQRMLQGGVTKEDQAIMKTLIRDALSKSQPLSKQCQQNIKQKLSQDYKEKLLAIKVIFGVIQQDQKDVISVERNAIQKIKNIDNPNIIHIYDDFLFKTDCQDEYYVVMDRAQFSLYQELKLHNQSKTYFDTYTIANYMYQILNGLNSCHEKNLAHLDIKSENILVFEVNQNILLKICDFSISKQLKQVCIKTLNGYTRPYMSPEMQLGQEFGLPTDVWSLGCILYELLTLNNLVDYCDEFRYTEVLKDGTNKHQSITDRQNKMKLNTMQHMKENIIPQIPDIHKQFMDLLVSMLQFDPFERKTTQQLLQHKIIVKAMVSREEYSRSLIVRKLEIVQESLYKNKNAKRARVMVTDATNSNVQFCNECAIVYKNTAYIEETGEIYDVDLQTKQIINRKSFCIRFEDKKDYVNQYSHKMQCFGTIRWNNGNVFQGQIYNNRMFQSGTLIISQQTYMTFQDTAYDLQTGKIYTVDYDSGNLKQKYQFTLNFQNPQNYIDQYFDVYEGEIEWSNIYTDIENYFSFCYYYQHNFNWSKIIITLALQNILYSLNQCSADRLTGNRCHNLTFTIVLWLFQFQFLYFSCSLNCFGLPFFSALSHSTLPVLFFAIFINKILHMVCNY